MQAHALFLIFRNYLYDESKSMQNKRIQYNKEDHSIYSKRLQVILNTMKAEKDRQAEKTFIS